MLFQAVSREIGVRFRGRNWERAGTGHLHRLSSILVRPLPIVFVFLKKTLPQTKYHRPSLIFTSLAVLTFITRLRFSLNNFYYQIEFTNRLHLHHVFLISSILECSVPLKIKPWADLDLDLSAKGTKLEVKQVQRAPQL